MNQPAVDEATVRRLTKLNQTKLSEETIDTRKEIEEGKFNRSLTKLSQENVDRAVAEGVWTFKDTKQWLIAHEAAYQESKRDERKAVESQRA